jgi:hypothetical protein
MELVDHIFVSTYLVAGIRTTGQHGRCRTRDAVDRRQPNGQNGKPGSDHAGAAATVDF